MTKLRARVGRRLSKILIRWSPRATDRPKSCDPLGDLLGALKLAVWTLVVATLVGAASARFWAGLTMTCGDPPPVRFVFSPALSFTALILGVIGLVASARFARRRPAFGFAMLAFHLALLLVLNFATMNALTKFG